MRKLAISVSTALVLAGTASPALASVSIYDPGYINAPVKNNFTPISLSSGSGGNYLVNSAAETLTLDPNNMPGKAGFSTFTASLSVAAPVVTFVVSSANPGTVSNLLDFTVYSAAHPNGILYDPNNFGFTSAGPSTERLFIDAGTGATADLITKIQFIGFGNVTISSFASSAPEPASWMMMIIGFGLVGGIMRSHRRQGKLTFA